MLILFNAFTVEVVFKGLVLPGTGTCLLTVVVFGAFLVVVGVALLDIGVFLIGVLSKLVFLPVVPGLVYALLFVVITLFYILTVESSYSFVLFY